MLQDCSAGRSPTEEVLQMGMMGWMMGFFMVWMMFFGGISFGPFGTGVQ